MQGLRIRLLLPVATLLLAAACAAGSSSRQVRGESVTVIVTNNLRPQSEVTVRLTSSQGVRQVLGTVPPNGTRRLQFEERSFSGTYQLSAESPDGTSVVSRSFPLFAGAEVEWALFSNSLNVDSR